MKKTLYAFFATTIVALSTATGTFGGGNSSATGDYVRSNGTHVVFNAVKHKDGTTTGTLYSETASGFITIAEYNDIVFTPDGKGAYLHAIVTYSTNPVLVGRESIQKVIDNGEGANEPADAVSSIVSLAGSWTFPGSIPFLDGLSPLGIIGGNIQVRAR